MSLAVFSPTYILVSLIAVVELRLETLYILEHLHPKPTSTEISALQERSRDFRRTKLFKAFPRCLIFSSNVPGRLSERTSPVNISIHDTAQHYLLLVLWFTAGDGYC